MFLKYAIKQYTDTIHQKRYINIRLNNTYYLISFT